MKRLFIALLLSGFILFSCSKSPNNPDDNNEPGAANITVKVGKVGILGKMRNIELSKLCISLSAPGEATIYDTIQLSGNNGTTISKTYQNLASLLKTWTLSVETRDIDGIVIHSGTQQFIVPARNTIDITLYLDAIYSELKANFYPIRDSVTRCELIVDENKVDDSSFAQQVLLGDTVKLSYNYLKTGISQRIKLDVYGNMWGFDTLLYTGDTSISPQPGINSSYTLTLKWVGPALPPPGQATMSVVLGPIGTVIFNGELQPKFIINEQFNEPVLSVDWNIFEFTGTRGYGYVEPANHYSLTDNSGHLRYYLDRMTHSDGYWNGFQSTIGGHSTPNFQHDPGLELRRAFVGTTWTLETKVDYNLPSSNGKWHELRVYFGDGSDGTICAKIWRYEDAGSSGQNDLDFYILEKTGTATTGAPSTTVLSYFHIHNALYSYYYRIVRNGSNLTLMYSPDNVEWNTACNADLGSKLITTTQNVVFTGLGWFTPNGSYADYDYIVVTGY